MPCSRSPNPSLPQQQDTIPYAVKISVLRSWRWTKDGPKHVELILEINKLFLQLVGSSILLYVKFGGTFGGTVHVLFLNFRDTLYWKRSSDKLVTRCVMSLRENARNCCFYWFFFWSDFLTEIRNLVYSLETLRIDSLSLTAEHLHCDVFECSLTL